MPMVEILRAQRIKRWLVTEGFLAKVDGFFYRV